MIADLYYFFQLVNKYDRPWLPEELKTQKPNNEKTDNKEDIKVEVTPIKGLTESPLYNLCTVTYIVNGCVGVSITGLHNCVNICPYLVISKECTDRLTP